MAESVSFEESANSLYNKSLKILKFYEALLTLEKTYTSSIGSIRSTQSSGRESLNGSWGTDQVRQNFDNYLDNSFLAGIQAIENDMINGGFYKIRQAAKELCTNISDCYYLRKDINEKKESRRIALNSDEEAVAESLAGEINTLEGNLREKISITNDNFNTLSTAEFEKDATGEPPAETATGGSGDIPVEEENQTPEYETEQKMPINAVYDYHTDEGSPGDIVYDAEHPENRKFTFFDYPYGDKTCNYYLDADGKYVCEVTWTNPDNPSEVYGQATYTCDPSDNTVTVTGNPLVDTPVSFVTMDVKIGDDTVTVPFMYQEGQGAHKQNEDGFNQGDASYMYGLETYGMEGRDKDMFGWDRNPATMDDKVSQYLKPYGDQPSSIEQAGGTWDLSTSGFGNIQSINLVGSTESSSDGNGGDDE